ncbi:hypothetical protein PENFLA_c015G10162 [Penicillium flavigenum]|uniref:Uncharacterized protein n=1 Tax=Penicillium flavigenum TaxID=254877 RepID=A0A1V6T3K2_9EURO|nr:hypothetical protein PENFLA_c015G10162 [Penicillium flavigenum]
MDPAPGTKLLRVGPAPKHSIDNNDSHSYPSPSEKREDEDKQATNDTFEDDRVLEADD